MFQKDQDIFNVLFEAVSEGTIVVDDLQNIVAANASAENMFGYNKKELIGQQLNILIPTKYHSGHGSHFDGFMKKNESRQMGRGRDLYGARKDGTIFPLEVGLNPFEIYGKTYVMALVIDISIRKEQELQIIALNTELEKKVEERTKGLNDVVNELKTVNTKLETEIIKSTKAEEVTKTALMKEMELNELKTKFLSLVSHEFKTPLSGILTSAILISKYKLTKQQENRDKHLKTITDRVHFLNNILNDFLSIEKLETGKINYNFKEFKLSKVVNEAVYNCNMLLKEGQKINYPENIDAMTLFQDDKIVELALSNILNNAIKYSSDHSIIDLIIKQNKKDTSFTVKDNGIGIPINDQKNIFNRYFRAENAVLTQGTGIGLNIVKSHLEKLGGSIQFESQENKGSSFTITIPNKAKQ